MTTGLIKVIYILIITTTTTLLIPPSYAISTLVTATNELVRPERCHPEKAQKYFGYNCANINLKEIPQYLKNMEILDLSFNRIRDLNRYSFQKYSDLKFLYLFENMIQTIDQDTFVDLTQLEAIDLSHNALRIVPMELFQLPYLRNLYLNNNNLFDLNTNLEALVKPIKAPLQYLNVANCNLNEVPNLGILPDLLHLNISTNPLKDITSQNFSPLCNLKTIDLNNTRMQPCTCQIIRTYLGHRSIKILVEFLCDVSPAAELIYCPDYTNSTVETDEFQACSAIKVSRKLNEKAKSTWFSVASGLFAFVVIFIGALYCIHLRNAKQMKKTLKNQNVVKPPPPIEENGNQEVLLEMEKR